MKKEVVWVIVVAVVIVAAVSFNYLGGDNGYNKGDIKCDYDSETKSYVSKSQDECSRIQVLCTPDREFFSNECGCGCELIGDGLDYGEVLNFCDPESREAEFCITLYAPVCGYSETASNIYSNSCVACKNENVEYWTEGECPALGSN